MQRLTVFVSGAVDEKTFFAIALWTPNVTMEGELVAGECGSCLNFL